MQKLLRTILVVSLLLGALGQLTGCSYSGVSTTPDDRVVVTRNDGFLYGFLRKVFVCKVTPSGLTDCKEGAAP